jgi:acetoin utilization deacetylase AcuC-like enzyme
MVLHENFKRQHVERPSRLMAIHTQFEKTGLYRECEFIECTKADIETIKLVHTKEHIDEVLNSKYSTKI